MPSPKSKVWPIDPHTSAKHDLLRLYLQAWFPVLGQYSRKVVFIDAFAGPGVYDDGSPGSPIIALTSLRDHSALERMRNCRFIFVFIESDPERYAHLKDEIEQLGKLPANFSVQTYNNTFAEVATEITSAMKDQNQSLAPTLAFLDPFGFSGVPMSLIADLLGGDKCEVFVTFMADHINRFSNHDRVAHHFTELFGTDRFQGVVGVEGMVNLYKEQLESMAHFPFVRDFGLFRKDGHPHYFMIHATRSEVGVKKMKDAMWKVDPASGQTFSDRYAGQGSLLVGEHVIVEALRAQLMDRFGGQVVSIEEVARFTLLKTDYHPDSHLKRMTLAPMERAGVITVFEPRPGRRRNTYPPGTQISFSEP